jgi:hypothetical protein
VDASTDVAAWAAAGVAMQGIRALTLALQLRCQERHDRERREHLVVAARELPSGSEVMERFGDGGSLFVKTGCRMGRDGRRARA